MWGVAAVAIIGGLLQAYNAERARGASEARLKEIRDLFNKMVPPDYDLSIDAPPELHEIQMQTPAFQGSLEAPIFDLNKLKPEEMKLLANYAPEAAPFIAEEAPKLVEKTPEMREALDAQRAALQRYQEIAASPEDPELRAALYRASRQAQADAQARQGAITQGFARRGMLGAGTELAAQLGAGAQAMDREAMLGQQAAAEAYRNRLNALAQSAQLGGQIYGQEEGTQARNVDILNAFNQRMSAARQQYENQMAQQQNQAQMYNLGAAQRIEEGNVQARNQAAIQAQQRADEIARTQYNAASQQQQRADELARWKYGADVEQQKYANQIAQAKADWAAAQRDKLNRLRSQQFQDQMDIASGKAGIARERAASDIATGQARGQAIGGVTSGVIGGMEYSDAERRREEEAAERQKDREAYGGYKYRSMQ